MATKTKRIVRIHHTPGQWKQYGWSIWAVNMPDQYSMKRIARCESAADYPLSQENVHEVMYANAKLMTAAPDMLAALEGVVSWDKGTQAFQDHSDDQRILKAVSAAITKAKMKP